MHGANEDLCERDFYAWTPARRLPVLYDQARRQLVTELERFDKGETAARLPEATQSVPSNNSTPGFMY